MKKGLIITVSLILLIGIAYLAGPRVEKVMLDPTLPVVTQNLAELESEIINSEKAIKNLKPDNEARIVWADDSKKEKTPYSIVYIHGFGASWAEGDPVHRNLAGRFGANLYLARLYDAGTDNADAFEDLTPQRFADGANRALAIGKALGDSVIVIGTSAGGLLTVYLAAHHPELKGIVLYSPCMDIYGSTLKIATGPWGAQAVNAIIGKRMLNDYSAERQKYWLPSYSSKGLIALQQTMDAVATEEVYSRIKMPVMLGYYYKNEDEQDKTVSVKAMQEMFSGLGTPEKLKMERVFPESGHHVIASSITSKDWEGVERETQVFFEQVLGLKVSEKSTEVPAGQEGSGKGI